MKFTICFITLFLTIVYNISAGIDDHIVVIEAPKRNLEIYGLYLKGGLVLSDAWSVKEKAQVKVTFDKGKANEITVDGQVIWARQNIACISVPGVGDVRPNGYALPEDFDIAKGISVNVWSYLNGYSSLGTSVDNVMQEGESICFSLPGYFDGCTGCPVTFDNGELAGLVVDSPDGGKVVSSSDFQIITSGALESASVSFRSLSDAGATYDVSMEVFDPLAKLEGVSFIYWIGPHYADRGEQMNMPGDSEHITLAMKKTAKNKYACSFTVSPAFDESVFFRYSRKTELKGSGRYLCPPECLGQHRIFASVKETNKEAILYMKGSKHPTGKDLTKIPTPKKVVEFPSVDLKSVDPMSFFPFREGNEWTYVRKQLYGPYGEISGGLVHMNVNDQGKVWEVVNTHMKGSNHEETYRICRVTGDNAWLTIFTDTDVDINQLRDGRYDNIRECILSWGYKDGFLALQEISKGGSDKAGFHRFRRLISLDQDFLRSNGASGLSSTEYGKIKFTWTTKNDPVYTYAGTFHNCLLVTESSRLEGNYDYTIESYYYPGVGLVKEEYELRLPYIAEHGNVRWEKRKTHELSLKAFTVKPVEGPAEESDLE